jgi:colicin import membrane protein
LQVPRLRAAPGPCTGTGRPPEYCAGRGHTRVAAWRERRRLAAEQTRTTISPAEDANLVTLAKMTGEELLRSLRAEADRAAAEQRAAAEARAAAAERRAARLSSSAPRPAGRDTAVAQADVGERVAAAEAGRDAEVAQARANAETRIRAAEAGRDQPRQAAASAEAAAREVRRDAACVLAGEQAARAETEWVRADADRMLEQVRADAPRERDERRADLRARAECPERQADACRDALDRLRTTADATEAAARTSRRRSAPAITG